MTNDPALTEPIGALFERNEARPLPGTGKPKSGPAANLRAACKLAIKPLGDLGSRPLWEPRVTAKVRFPGAKQDYLVGNKGQADVIVTWFGHAFHAEMKAGKDRLRDSQQRYRKFVEAAGGTWVTVRSSADLVKAMRDWYATMRR